MLKYAVLYTSDVNYNCEHFYKYAADFSVSYIFYFFAAIIDGGRICTDCNHGKKC